MCIALLLGTTSCKDWLDVNTDPDSPSAETATVDVRLPWIQYYYMYAWGNACFRTNLTTQMFAMASRTATNSLLMEWDYAQGHSTTAYQNWFIGADCNIHYLYDATDKEGILEFAKQTGATLTVMKNGMVLHVLLHTMMVMLSMLLVCYILMRQSVFSVHLRTLQLLHLLRVTAGLVVMPINGRCLRIL